MYLPATTTNSGTNGKHKNLSASSVPQPLGETAAMKGGVIWLFLTKL